MNYLVRRFQQYAYVLPLLVLGIGAMGRGVTNSLLFLYFLWGVIASVGALRNICDDLHDRKIMSIAIIWLAVYTSFLISNVYNDALDIGWKQLLVAFLSSTTLLFTLWHANQFHLLFNNKLLKWSLLFILALYLYQLTGCMLDENCHPASSVSVMTLSVMYSFSVIFIYHHFHNNWLGWFIVFSVVISVLVFAANSRTEVLMVAFSTIIIISFYYKKIVLILLMPLVFLCVLLAFSHFHHRGNLSVGNEKTEMQDTATLVRQPSFNQNRNTAAQENAGKNQYQNAMANISSSRVRIFNLVKNNPPENVFLGAGVNNTQKFLPETHFHSALHDAYLEIWYETGYLGLILWFSLIVFLLGNIRRAYLFTENRHRLIYSAFLGGLMAVMTAGTFDKGYMSIYFTFFIYYLGAVLFLLGSEKAFDQFKSHKQESHVGG